MPTRGQEDYASHPTASTHDPTASVIVCNNLRSFLEASEGFIPLDILREVGYARQEAPSLEPSALINKEMGAPTTFSQEVMLLV